MSDSPFSRYAAEEGEGREGHAEKSPPFALWVETSGGDLWMIPYQQFLPCSVGKAGADLVRFRFETEEGIRVLELEGTGKNFWYCAHMIAKGRLHSVKPERDMARVEVKKT